MKSESRILITGARGMLGTDLVQHFQGVLGPARVVATGSDSLDITSREAVEEAIERIKPAWVINAAAYTDVDKAETEREKALMLNAVGPKVLSESCQKFGARFVHFSTEYVFNGMGEKPWTENDEPNPPQPNHYAQTKLLGERAALQYEGTLLLRVQWLYGLKRDRFTTLRDKAVFTPFVDQFGAPTWTRDVSRIVGRLIEKDASGVFHFAYDDYASWYDVYDFVKQELGFDTELIAKRSSEARLPARRPAFGVMSNRKLLQFLGLKQMGSWKVPFAEFLQLASTQPTAPPVPVPVRDVSVPIRP